MLQIWLQKIIVAVKKRKLFIVYTQAVCRIFIEI